MNAPRPLVFLLLCGAVFSAAAQWQWLDKDGRKVFSDRPPPVDVPARSILKQPGGATPPSGPGVPAVAAPTVPAPRGPTAATPPTLPRATGKDAELEARKREAENAEAATRKAEEERIARAKADNCQRARQTQATLDSGIRIAQVNAQGERIVMDDAARAAEMQRNQAVMASDCR